MNPLPTTAMLAIALTSFLTIAPGTARATKPAAAAATAPALASRLAAPTAVAESFSAAIKAGDFDAARELLDERVLILESGGAQRTREEYLGHHAVGDAAYLRTATIRVTNRSGDVAGDMAWLATESEIASGTGATAKTTLSTETMVLARKAGNWKIVHIHWSSRPKKAGAK